MVAMAAAACLRIGLVLAGFLQANVAAYESPLEPPCAVHHMGHSGFNDTALTLPLPSSEACFQACQPHQGCNYFTWNESSTWCYLQIGPWPNTSEFIRMRGIVSGHAPCTWEQAPYFTNHTSHLAVEYDPPCSVLDQGFVLPPGQVPNMVWLSTPQECYDLCKLEQSALDGVCDYYTWNETSGACILLTSSIDLIWQPSLPGIVGGPLSCDVKVRTADKFLSSYVSQLGLKVPLTAIFAATTLFCIFGGLCFYCCCYVQEKVTDDLLHVTRAAFLDVDDDKHDTETNDEEAPALQKDALTKATAAMTVVAPRAPMPLRSYRLTAVPQRQQLVFTSPSARPLQLQPSPSKDG